MEHLLILTIVSLSCDSSEMRTNHPDTGQVIQLMFTSNTRIGKNVISAIFNQNGAKNIQSLHKGLN